MTRESVPRSGERRQGGTKTRSFGAGSRENHDASALYSRRLDEAMLCGEPELPMRSQFLDFDPKRPGSLPGIVPPGNYNDVILCI